MHRTSCTSRRHRGCEKNQIRSPNKAGHNRCKTAQTSPGEFQNNPDSGFFIEVGACVDEGQAVEDQEGWSNDANVVAEQKNDDKEASRYQWDRQVDDERLLVVSQNLTPAFSLCGCSSKSR